MVPIDAPILRACPEKSERFHLERLFAQRVRVQKRRLPDSQPYHLAPLVCASSFVIRGLRLLFDLWLFSL